MTKSDDEIVFSEDIKLQCTPTAIDEKVLKGLIDEIVFSKVKPNEDSDTIEEVHIDFSSLARLMYRYETLDMSASHVKVDILHHFRTEDANKFSTGELVEATGRNDSNVSEALGKLVEDGHLRKIQKGFYALKD